MLNTELPVLHVSFRNRSELRKNFLYGPPHGGLVVITRRTMLPGYAIDLCVRFEKDCSEERIRGAVLWCRRRPEDEEGFLVGVGFFSSEVEKRERLIATPPPSQAESKERIEYRYPTTLKVTYPSAADFVVDYAKNISTGGIFVDGPTTPPVGEGIRFQLYPPGELKPIELMGRVAWKRPGGGFGVQFLDSDGSSRQRLEKLVRNIAVDISENPSNPIFEEVISGSYNP